MDEPEFYMAKYDAHDGMITQMDRASVEISLSAFRQIKNKYGAARYRLSASPDSLGIRLYPDDMKGVSFHHREDPKAPRAIISMSETSFPWITHLPSFTLSKCSHILGPGFLEIRVPSIRKPPIQKNFRKRLTNGYEGKEKSVEINNDVVTAGRRVATTPSKRLPIEMLVAQINATKLEFGDGMSLSVSPQGQLKVTVMVEYG